MRRTRVISVVCTFYLLAAAGHAFASGITNSGDDLRTGWYPNQPSITPQLVGGGTFGQLWEKNVEGQVYAQPLLANGTLFIATEENKIYGLDPTDGATQWGKTLPHGTPWNPSDIGCGDLSPSIGVTSTPVIDPATNIAYLTHKTYASGSSGEARWWMDAIELATGKEKTGFPVELGGNAQDHSSVTFQPTTQLQRPGLLLLEGVVYAAFGSDCDIEPWQGWVFGVSTSGQVKARWADLAEGNGAGIWQSGAGLTSDRPGSILLSTGNGGSPEDTPTPGSAPPENLGNSVVRLQVQPGGELIPTDFFAPWEAQELDGPDIDFASGGVTGLPEQYFGTSAIPRLAVVAGKQGYVYLLNRDILGGIGEGPLGRKSDHVVWRSGQEGGVWSRPGVWPGEGGWVYIPTASEGERAGATSGNLDVYQYGLSGAGTPELTLKAKSSEDFGFTTSAPVITSNGTTPGSALVWFIWTSNGEGNGAQLRAYEPTPVNGEPVLVKSWPIGTSAKFAIPGVGAGRIFVGTRNGKVRAFGSPNTPALIGSATPFPATQVGGSSQQTLTLTATETLTLEKLESSSPEFTSQTTSPPLPATLTTGQTVEVPVAFSPTGAGPASATLTARTSTGEVNFALSGIGTSSQPPPGAPITGSVLAAGGGLQGSKEGQKSPDAKLVRTILTASSAGIVNLEVSCPAAESSCSGRVTLRTLTAIAATGGARARTHKASILTLGSVSFKVPGGRVVTVKLHLSSRARVLLARLHVLRARATIVARDAIGLTHTARPIVTIREAKPRARAARPKA